MCMCVGERLSVPKRRVSESAGVVVVVVVDDLARDYSSLFHRRLRRFCRRRDAHSRRRASQGDSLTVVRTSSNMRVRALPHAVRGGKAREEIEIGQACDARRGLAVGQAARVALADRRRRGFRPYRLSAWAVVSGPRRAQTSDNLALICVILARLALFPGRAHGGITLNSAGADAIRRLNRP